MKKAVKISLSDFSNQNQSETGFIIGDRSSIPSKLVLNQANILDGVAFFICIKGTAKASINFRNYDVKPNTVLTILPNHIFKALERSEDFSNIMLIFSLDFISNLPVHLELIKQIGANPCIQASDEDMEVLLDIYALLVKLFNQKKYILREDIAKSMLYTLILQLKAILHNNISEQTQNEKPNRQIQLTEQFFKLLIENFKEERSCNFYADKLFVSTKYLSQVVREVTGESVFAWINKAVIIGIKRKLSSSDLSISQIADEFNFSNPSFFGRYFKKHTGMTPGKYRKE